MAWIITMGWPLTWSQISWSVEDKWAIGSITMNKASGGDGIPVELFQIPKCCESAALNMPANLEHSVSSYRTGKGQLSFQSQRRAMSKNVQTTVQLHSLHRLVRLHSKSFKLAFSSMWTENLQMYKLGLEKAGEPEIKFPAFTGSQRKQGNSRKTSASATTQKPSTVWITTNCGKFFKR